MFKPAAALVAVDWVCHCCGGLEAAVMVEMVELVEMAKMVEIGRCQRWWAIKGWRMSRWSKLGKYCQGWRMVMLERG